MKTDAVSPGFRARDLRPCLACHLQAATNAGRCADCEADRLRDAATKLAVQLLNAIPLRTPVRRRIVAKMLARSVEQQAKLFGIDTTIPAGGASWRS